VNDDAHAGNEGDAPAPTPTPEHAAPSRPDEINGYTDVDAPTAAESQNGNGRGEQVQESPAPPDMTMEAEVAAKTDAPKRKGWWNRFGG
jgi:hypothetical protein